MRKRGESNFINNKYAQVWIETVIYTLIAFILIGAVLAFAKPKIEEMQDKAYIEQSISMIKELDDTVLEIVRGGSGNKRKLEVSIKKGDLEINAIENTIIFEIESRYVYSQPGEEISDGNFIIKTEKLGDLNTVTIKRVYPSYDIKFTGAEEIKTISTAATPYKIFIENKGKTEEDEWNVDISLG